jgi:phosphatidylinositol-3-phosphatase
LRVAKHIRITFRAGGFICASKYGQHITHYSVLRTIEDIFGVKALRHAASATPITGVVK